MKVICIDDSAISHCNKIEGLIKNNIYEAEVVINEDNLYLIDFGLKGGKWLLNRGRFITLAEYRERRLNLILDEL